MVTEDDARRGAEPSLRQRKRARTRQALIDAATDLFDRQGYDETTVAAIAAAADVSTRTFFGYFASKEELAFPDSADRIRRTVAAIADRRPAETPAETLLRAFDQVTDDDADMLSPMAAVRTRLVGSVPALRGRALQIQYDGQREMALALRAAYPGELELVDAAAMVGALLGAVTVVLGGLLAAPDGTEPAADGPDELRRTARRALRTWL